jgi:hypothetical protein
MTGDEQPNDEALEQLVARSNALQRYLLAVLSQGGYSEVPTLVVHALSELTAALLASQAATSLPRLDFALRTLDHMRGVVEEAGGISRATRRH